jgi:hemerythrin-like domain-containing protein
VRAQGGPIGVMLAEHDQGRACLKAIRENLDAAERGSSEAREQVFGSAEAYVLLLRQHIYKEDHILFRMARRVLRPEDVAGLQRQFAAVEVPERFLDT